MAVPLGQAVSERLFGWRAVSVVTILQTVGRLKGTSEDVSSVVLVAAGVDVAAKDALVLVAGGRRDLGGVVPVAGGLGRVPGPKRVAGERLASEVTYSPTTAAEAEAGSGSN